VRQIQIRFRRYQFGQNPNRASLFVRVKYWEIIADNLSKVEWSWGCVSAIDSDGRTIWIADETFVHPRGLFLFKSFLEHFYQSLTRNGSLSAIERPPQILRIQ
jgi:hypothetical protein